jgi:hypothetical protein
MTEPRTVQVPTQPVTTSKTVWVNVITILVGIAVWAGVTTNEQWTPEQIEALAGVVIGGVGVVNLILRVWFTQGPVTINNTAPALKE